MKKTAIHTPKAPAAIGPYSQAIVAGGAVYTSGQLGLVPQTGEMVDGGVGAETEQALTNLQHVLQQAGAELAQVVKTTIYLTEMSNFGVVNGVYAKFFNDTPPARTTVGVAALPKGALVEIDAIAVNADGTAFARPTNE